MPKKKVTPHKSKTNHSSQKPRGYWDDFANVETELRAFIAEHGTDGIMPTVSELDAGYSSLTYAIRKHGGISTVAERLSLKRPDTRKLKGYGRISPRCKMNF